ncbi:MAG: hypothetical protein V3R37_09515 [Rhodospirillales bacterium]
MRHFPVLFLLPIVGSHALITRAGAHGVVGGEDSGNEFFWLYGLVLASLGGFLVYRKWRASQETPEHLAQKRRLRDYERDYAMCMSQLKNADDYPEECGLTQAERQDRVQSAAAIQENIDKIKAELDTS